MRKKILIIGPYPPPIGGVSVHLMRLQNTIKKQMDIMFVDESRTQKTGIYNMRHGNIFQYLKLLYKADVVHIHSGVPILRLFHIIFARFLFHKKTVVTIHRDPSVEKGYKITKWFVSKCNHAILVNKKGFDIMLTHSACQYHLIPAFIPPIFDDEPPLPNEIQQWIKCAHAKNNMIAVSNAWNLILHNEEDLYGIDICIKAFNILKTELKISNMCLIFVVATNTTQQKLMESYKKLIKDYQLEDNVKIWEHPLSFVRLIKESDIVLRATNTDGDALSLREALYCNKKVIASDVVERPKGTILFKTRDAVDLANKIKETYVNKGIVYDNEEEDFSLIYLDIYNH